MLVLCRALGSGRRTRGHAAVRWRKAERPGVGSQREGGGGFRLECPPQAFGLKALLWDSWGRGEEEGAGLVGPGLPVEE